MKNKAPVYAIFYTLLALILAVVGFWTQKISYVIGAVIVSLCAFYWIWKSWKDKRKV